MNILLTSAGRRTYMVDYFKEALGDKGLLFAANSQMSPALSKADGYFITPIIYSDEYIPFLLGKCRELGIDLLVSLFDIDIPVLSAHRQEFEAIGTVPAVSGPEMLKACNDKLEMGLRLKSAGIASPESFLTMEDALEALDSGSISWPFLIKPRFGMGSIGVLKAFDEMELAGAFSMCRRSVGSSYLKFESAAAPEAEVLIQECCTGSEYGMDLICDLKGNYVNTIIRKKYAMRSGETDEAVILGSSDHGYKELMEVSVKLAELLHPVGLTDVDVIMDEQELIPRVIDINARFGGGYPFSHVAGADVPRAYIMWAEEMKNTEKAVKTPESAGRDCGALGFCTAKPGVHGYKDIVPKAYSQQPYGQQSDRK